MKIEMVMLPGTTMAVGATNKQINGNLEIKFTPGRCNMSVRVSLCEYMHMNVGTYANQGS